ncbi:MAG: DJ-1/PfpI family protein [Chlamydiota bacterium]|nr:DJ-1/PfpI family protein [Chlamydiota bacterium]
MGKTALIILAEGFEEIEAVSIIDTLRRGEIRVIIAGLSQVWVTGAHEIKIQADILLEKFDGSADAIILPGGLPGAENLAQSQDVIKLVMDFYEKDKIVSAICAAPALVLGKTGILKGKRATCYPGFEKQLGEEVHFDPDQSVVEDGNILTSKGPGTALSFALSLVRKIKDQKTADSLKQAMLVCS